MAGNLVSAIQGIRYTESFAIDTAPASNPQMPLAMIRTGPNNTPDAPAIQYLYPLQHARMAWLAQEGLDALPLPEIDLATISSITPLDVAQTFAGRGTF